MPIITSPAMSLPIPVVGSEAGPQYATDVNNCLGIVDQHNHSPGNGNPINPSGMNINADLSFNGNNLILARSLRLQPQLTTLAGASDIGCLYEAGVDLYYNDGSGNQVRITQSGALAGTPGSISGLVPPASVSYSSGTQTFIFQSNTNTPANLDAGFITLRNNVINSFGLSLFPPAAMGSNQVITLPTTPASTKILTMDNTGTMASVTDVDNSSIEISGNNIQIKNQGVTQAKKAIRVVTTNGTDPGAGGMSTQADPGAIQTFTSLTDTQVANLVCTLTTLGNPVTIYLTDGGFAGSGAFIGSDFTFTETPNNAIVYLSIYRDGTPIYSYGFGVTPAGHVNIPPSSICATDFPAPGTYTYTIWARTTNAGQAVRLGSCKIVAYEV